jgi:hypothetical protein
MAGSDANQIDAGSKLNEVLARAPSAGQILVQAGRGWVNKKGDLYAQFPDLTVAQYAEMNGLELGALIARLRAAAESDALARKAGHDAHDDEDVWRRPPLTIGYTSSYDEREGMSPGNVPVTHVQSERGPV